MLRRSILTLACLAAIASATPAAAQAFTYDGLAWGSSRTVTWEHLQRSGARLGRDMGNGTIVFRTDSASVYVTVDQERDRLVGVDVVWYLPDSVTATARFSRLADSISARLGPPDSLRADARFWASRRDRALVWLSFDPKPQGGYPPPHVVLRRRGPGYDRWQRRAPMPEAPPTDQDPWPRQD